MLWRVSARIVTGPAAFFAGWLLDVFAFAAGLARARLGRLSRRS